MPPWDRDDHRIFIFRLPDLGPKKREIGIYSAGALFALGWWNFIDGITLASNNQTSRVHLGIEDWLPGILATFGMIVINLLDKTRLQGDSFAFTGTGIAWKARLFLFVGFALLSAGLAGSVSVLVLKYVVQNIDMPELYYGASVVGQCVLITLSTAILWIAQNTEPDYQYNFVL